MKYLLVLLLGLSVFAGCRKKPSPPPTGQNEAPSASAPQPGGGQSDAASAPPPTGPAEAAPAAPDAGAPPNAAASGEIMDLSTIRNALDSYVKKTGKVPEDLSVLVKAGYLRSLPMAPAGYRLFYDPITVTVSMPKKW